jgi:hypothetical protein
MHVNTFWTRPLKSGMLLLQLVLGADAMAYRQEYPVGPSAWRPACAAHKPPESVDSRARSSMQSMPLCCAERLGVDPAECVVIEDSEIGVAAATGAGMRCIVTYTASTQKQPFGGAERIVKVLGDNPAEITVVDLMASRVVQDDRVEFAVDDESVTMR